MIQGFGMWEVEKMPNVILLSQYKWKKYGKNMNSYISRKCRRGKKYQRKVEICRVVNCRVKKSSGAKGSSGKLSVNRLCNLNTFLPI